ncbi:T7SS effector LXG polymorphic toxin [Staphylococcus pettenkoferi]|uniref:LXG domain-containing protein n=1 Tax=Staphylococcus pettenkoferi TaxID=170573 RepID=A0A9Q4D6M3_9STAP|nr:T7SS effector LXG polymorphic toxin [Staphylococcus pettenkoferi]MCY1569410.1 LXG domain-containing protein [Staphylococcus pettenkoferi]MCY1575758.1 LXG domain-containing protein [Staphylococcus pettenkoferi]MCY1594367.1 LXG domain-containing protein [Staphylococcus pettenkoferi]MCY1617341.1 LXG domain-containing protein [Staphylococcus pettenkoferi]
MSIDMYLRNAEDQSSKVEKTSKDLTDKYDDLQNAISQFVNESELKGKAYDSGKQFFSTVIQPLTDSIKTLGDLTEQACSTFVDKYKSEVDTHSLKESELEEDIHELKQQIDELNSISESTPPGNSLLIAAHHRMVESLENQKRDLEDKLNKLRLFNRESANIFKEVESFKQTVQQGIEQARTSWDSGTQTFNIPSTKELEWTKVTQQKVLKVQVNKILQKLKEGLNLNRFEKHLVKEQIENPSDKNFLAELKEYLSENKESIIRDLAIDTGASSIEFGGIGMQQLGGEFNVYGGYSGPEGENSFVQITNQSGNKMIKQGKSVVTIGKVGGAANTVFGFGIGMYDDLQDDKTVGESLAHNSLTTGAGIAGGIVVTSLLTTNPIGWTILAGIAVSTVVTIFVDTAYQNNWFHLKDGTDWVGHQVDKGINEINNKIDKFENEIGQGIKNMTNPRYWGA